MAPPAHGTPEYLWWSRGAADEAKARNEGLATDVAEAREALEALARLDPAAGRTDVLTALARIYCPSRLRRRYRKPRT